MKVGLVSRFLGMPIGLGTYAAELVAALDRRDDDHEYVIYTPSWNDVPELGTRFAIRRSYVPRNSPPALALWDLVVPSSQAARDRPDVLHYLYPAFPARRPQCPTAVSLLDAIRWLVPGYRQRQPYQWLEDRAARSADMLVTLSESARTDIEQTLGVPKSKIHITYLGGPPLDAQPSPKEPYFLFVGGTERRKNVAAVLDAFASIDGFQLHVVGQNTASRVHDDHREQDGVRWLGHISDEALVEQYRRATALVYPSRYEGFGLPVLEAMARRTPVIASTSSSIPEVARDGAILIDPDDTQGLHDAMAAVAADAGLREQLVSRGVEVLSAFSWDRTANATAAVYEALRRPSGASGAML